MFYYANSNGIGPKVNVSTQGELTEIPAGCGEPVPFNPSGSEYYIVGIDYNNPNLVIIKNTVNSEDIHYVYFNTSKPFSGDFGLTLSRSQKDAFTAFYNKYTQAVIEYNNRTSGSTTNGSFGGVPVSVIADSDGDEIVIGDLYEGSNDPINQVDSSSYVIQPILRSYGLPPQWTRYVDPRVLTCKFTGGYNAVAGLGRRFLAVTVANPTIVEIAPGYIHYCDGFLNRDELADGFSEFTESGDTSTLSDLLSGNDGTFFTIKPAFVKNSGGGKINGYSGYLDVLLQIASIYMSRRQVIGGNDTTYSRDGIRIELGELKDRPVPGFGNAYKKFEWEYYDKSSGWINLFGSSGITVATNGTTSDDATSGGITDGFDYIRFFASGQTRSSDQFDTSITESMIGQALNSASSAVKDVAFIIQGLIGDPSNSGLVDDYKNEMKGAASSVTYNGSDIMGGLINGILAISEGGKVVFPQIIDDCTYGKTMTVECTFPAVYGDAEANYLNCMVPFMHILAFCLPHQVKTSLDMYTYPFLVRAFSKGLFDCPMGVITNFSVERGGNDNELWTFDSNASEITVSFAITPLVSKLVITSIEDGPGWIMKNGGMREFIGAICGIDLRKNQIDMGIELFETMFGNAAVSWASNLLNPLLTNEKVASVVNMYRGWDDYSDGRNISDIFGDEVARIAENIF